MHTAKERLAVQCKIEDAFEYVADWHNFVNFLPLVLNLKPTSLVEYGPGSSLEATLVVGRLQISTELDTVEFQKNKRLVVKASRGVRIKLVWEFKDVGGKVLVSFDFDYEVPPALVLNQTERESAEKDLDATVAKSMELLKWILESMPPSED
jgi:ribosome-associated toxin RatA of RatAB toxin-antitoxin module